MFSDMDSINFLSICFMLFVMRLKSKVPIGTLPYLELLKELLDEWEMAVKELTPAGWYWQQPSHLQNHMV